MRRTTAASLIAVIGCTAAISGCGSGSSSLLSPGQAQSINSALDRVDAAVASGDCPGTAASIDRLRGIVAALPSSVDAALRANLNEGTSKVASMSLTDCAKNSTTSSTTSTSTTSSQPTTSTSSTTSSSTTSTTSTTTSTTPTTSTSTTTTGGGGTPPGGM